MKTYAELVAEAKRKEKRKSNIIVSIAVALCLLPVIIFLVTRDADDSFHYSSGTDPKITRKAEWMRGQGASGSDDQLSKQYDQIKTFTEVQRSRRRPPD